MLSLYPLHLSVEGMGGKPRDSDDSLAQGSCSCVLKHFLKALFLLLAAGYLLIKLEIALSFLRFLDGM